MPLKCELITQTKMQFLQKISISQKSVSHQFFGLGKKMFRVLVFFVILYPPKKKKKQKKRTTTQKKKKKKKERERPSPSSEEERRDDELPFLLSFFWMLFFFLLFCRSCRRFAFFCKRQYDKNPKHISLHTNDKKTYFCGSNCTRRRSFLHFCEVCFSSKPTRRVCVRVRTRTNNSRFNGIVIAFCVSLPARARAATTTTTIII